MDVICTLVVVALGIAAVWWISSASRANASAWELLERENEIERPRTGHVRAQGKIGNTPFKYQRFKHGSDVLVPIPCEEMGDLHVSHEHALNKLAKKLGGQDITFDDPIFDGAWRVTCRHPEIARRVLRRSVRIALHNTRTDLGAVYHLEVFEGQLRCSVQGGCSPAELERVVRLLGKCARKFAPKKPKAAPSDLEDDDTADGST